MIDDPKTPSPIEIPHESLSSEALNAVLESYILREGTDYGRQEVAYTTKIEQLRRQLHSGQIKIVFDPASESVTLLTLNDWKKWADL
jgi:uncharacterized protein YheU (UPF0270 family)